MAVIVDRWQAAKRRTIDSDTEACSAHRAFEYPSREDIKNETSRIAAINVAKIVLGEIRLHPNVAGRDEGHLWRASTGEIAAINSYVGHHTSSRGNYFRSLDIQLCSFERGQGLLDAGIVVAQAAEILLCLFEISARCCKLLLRNRQRRFRRFQTTIRDGARILILDTTQPHCVLLGTHERSLRGANTGLSRINARGRCSGSLARRLQACLGTRYREAKTLIVELKQHITGLHNLVICYRHICHGARHVRRYRYNPCMHTRLRGNRRNTVRHEIRN